MCVSQRGIQTLISLCNQVCNQVQQGQITFLVSVGTLYGYVVPLIVFAITYHINKGRDEDEDNGEYSNQGAVGARLDYLL